MQIKLSAEPFNPWQILHDYETGQRQLAGQYGATAVFVGTMRDFNQGDDVVAMQLDHYPGMTEKQLTRIVEQAQQQWAILDGLLLHRVGKIEPSDTLVIVAVWSAHRGDAFDASRFIMEALKQQAPFWKQETLSSGEVRWVSSNSDGYLKTAHNAG